MNYGIQDGQPFQWDDPEATTYMSMADFRTLSAGGEIENPVTSMEVATIDSRSGPADVDSRFSAPADSTTLAKYKPPAVPEPVASLPALGAVVGTSLVIAQTVAAPTLGGIAFSGGLAGLAIGWCALWILPPSQEAVEYDVMREIEMNDWIEDWERVHSLTVEDYIQKMLAAPGKPPAPSPPPDWVPHSFYKIQKAKSFKIAYVFPFFLLLIILFRRRRKRRKDA